MTNLRIYLYNTTHLIAILSLCFTSFAGYAAAKLPSAENVSISDARVRPTNPGQEVGAAYMTLTSKQDATLIGVESDATKSIEIHSMTMKNGVMKMRMLKTIDLAAGKPYSLAPGGYHLMLFDLKKPLTEGETVRFTLYFKNKNNAKFQQTIQAKVQADSESSNEHQH